MTFILSDVVEAIKQSVSVSTLKMGEKEYFSREVFLPPKERVIEPLNLHTLTGLIDYLKSDPDKIKDQVFIHIVNETRVKVFGLPSERDRERECFAICDCKTINGSGFDYGRFMNQENFVINLQTYFVDEAVRGQVLKVVGNLRESAVRESSDDGTSQSVVVKAGIASVENGIVPNPVSLRPYRTFREIDQPTSVFIFRLQGGSEKEKPKAALFEADGSEWKLEAIQNIKKYLEKADLSVPIIA